MSNKFFGPLRVRNREFSVFLYIDFNREFSTLANFHVVFLLQVKKDFAFSLYDLDWDVFSAHIGGAINRVPAVEHIEVKATVCGPGS